MRKIFFLSAVFLQATLVAQWTDSGSNITTADNVGIGTVSPQSKLHIQQDGPNGIRFSRSGHDTYELLVAGAKGLFIKNLTDGTEEMVFDGNGNVGIGTSNPSGILELRSSTNNGITFNQDNTPAVSFIPNNGNSHFHISHTLNNQLTISQGATLGSNKLVTILTNGNLGVGHTQPEEKLHVNGTATIVSDIGIPNDAHWKTGHHSFELQNNDAGDVVLSFHRSGQTNAAIKHTSLGGLLLNGNGGPTLEHFFISPSGDIGVGTTTPDAKLAVNGDIHAQEVRVDMTNWPDYVFTEDFDLLTLEEVEKHIKEHGHLINIPSAQEVNENGVQLGEMNRLLLEKIEELTLHLINQQKEIMELKKQNASFLEYLNKK